GPVIEPVGEAKPNEEVFRRLAERLGIADGYPHGEALLRHALDAIEGPLGPRDGPRGGAARLARLRRDGILQFDFPGDRPVQFATVFPDRPDRKADLWPADLGADPYVVHDDPARDDPGGDAYPLALISPATDRT